MRVRAKDVHQRSALLLEIDEPSASRSLFHLLEDDVGWRVVLGYYIHVQPNAVVK